MRKTVLAICGLFMLAVGFSLPVPALSAGDSTKATQEAKYLVLRAALYDPTSLLPDEDSVAAISRAIKGIRANYPEVKDISTHELFLSGTPLYLHVSSNKQTIHVCRELGDGRSFKKIATQSLGITELDEITRRFNGTYTRLSCSGEYESFSAYIDFPDLLHLQSLVSLYEDTFHVFSAGIGNVPIGGYDYIYVEAGGDQWNITFSHGWGDCPAGCIDQKYFFFTASADGTQMQKLGEWQMVYDHATNTTKEVGNKPWDIPRP